MTDTSPATEIRAAAERLRALATAAAEASGGDRWEARRRWPDDPDHTSTTLWAGPGKNLLHGHTRGRAPGPFVTGPVGDYIAAMHPTVALAFAQWLEDAAKQEAYTLAEWGHRGGGGPRALTIARAINTQEQP